MSPDDAAVVVLRRELSEHGRAAIAHLFNNRLAPLIIAAELGESEPGEFLKMVKRISTVVDKISGER